MAVSPVGISIANGKVVYYLGPKIGKTTIKTYAILINESHFRTTNPELYDTNAWSLPYTDQIKKNIMQTLSGMSYKELYALPMAEEPTVYDGHSYQLPLIPANNEVRFCIVRDPVERFISSYFNRVIGTNGANLDISFDEFVIDFDYYFWKYRDIEVHFKQQVYNYGYNPKLYTNIYNLKQMPDIKRMLENYAGPLPDLHLNKTDNKLKQQLVLTDTIKNLIKKRYAIDYEVYGQYF